MILSAFAELITHFRTSMSACDSDVHPADAGLIDTSRHRICAKDVTILGSWAFTASDIPLGIQMIHRIADREPWHLIQRQFPFSQQGVAVAVDAAMVMQCTRAHDCARSVEALSI